jgi:hypothetical protein
MTGVCMHGKAVNSMVMSNDLFDFMVQATKEMADEYARIQKRATEDPGTAGDQGEENWATLLRRYLPPQFRVVTKGRILGHQSSASPQVDVLVLSPSYPEHLRDKKLYLAGGVEAAFECKTTLKAEHITTATRNAAAIRGLLPERTGTPYRELHSPITYGLLAHSHSWKGSNSTPVENVTSSLHESDQLHTKHPSEMLDLVCVADLATWTAGRTTFLGPRLFPDPTFWEGMKPMYGEHGSATTGYFCYSISTQNQIEGFTPIGTMYSHLYNRLAWTHPDMRSLADYFRLANLGGSGQDHQRLWPISIYSEVVQGRVEAGLLTNGVGWDEWSVSFI